MGLADIDKPRGGGDGATLERRKMVLLGARSESLSLFVNSRDEAAHFGRFNVNGIPIHRRGVKHGLLDCRATRLFERAHAAGSKNFR